MNSEPLPATAESVETPYLESPAASFAAPALVAPQFHAGYYRSKLFTLNATANPLLNAAWPLLSFATHLHQMATPTSLTELHYDLCHEIKAFETKLQDSAYRPAVIMAARYALCAFIDEIILDTAWGRNSQWRYHNLSHTFQGETGTQDKFFVILERSSADPENHLDLLELMYICLSLGYQGQYQHKEKGAQILSETLNHLYALLQQKRGEIDKQLTVHFQTHTSTSLRTPDWLPWILVMFLTLLLSTGIYGVFDYLLSNKANSFYQTLQQLTSS